MSSKKPLSTDELACIYSALILIDDDIPVTSDKIVTILRAAEVQVEPIWPTMYARALQGINLRQLVASAVTQGDGLSSGEHVATGAATESSAAPEETKPDVKKVEEMEDSSDEDLGLGLFD